jgi:hypothetical protein
MGWSSEPGWSRRRSALARQASCYVVMGLYRVGQMTQKTQAM